MDLQKEIRDRRQRILLRLAVRGSEDAFRRLYRELFMPVSRYIQIRVHNREEAEDICANVFRNFLLHLDSFDPTRGSVMTWIVTMARNAVIDHYRHTRPGCEGTERLCRNLTDTLDTLADEQPGPLQAIINNEEIERVRRLLDRQPAEIREMFSLRFDQGLRVREIAEVMGLSPDAVKQRFARTFRKLQQELTDEDKPRGGERPCAATD
ncbi:MAG: sigma-70 family RNA polymerase sigma factor [Candidatus Latescibacterota bacterium]|nr:MAG: sigma-70 family RNA polymerase sigma factor [Candidatus Latescibacterota bacterium]